MHPTAILDQVFVRISSVSSSPMSSSLDAAAQIRSLAHASGVLQKADLRSTHILCEAVKRTMWSSARRMVSDSCRLPMLSTKSCDGTPIRVAHRTTRRIGKHATVQSCGKEGREFLVSHQFIKANLPEAGWTTKVVLPEPMTLNWGKSAPATLSVAFKEWSSLRQLGHTGIAIEHYAFDRFAIGALERLCRQWHFEQSSSDPPDGMTVDEARALEIVVCTPCALHDAQNAFRWAFLPQCCDSQLMRDLYVSIESLRNSHSLIQEHIGTLGPTSLESSSS